MLVLEQIVEGSTAMFERLAQFEDFHYTVDLPILVSAAQEKVIKWLAKWQPKKGRLFSWFSKCLSGESRVLLADGTYARIDGLKNRINGATPLEVVCWNEETGQLTVSKVTHWHKNAAVKAEWRKLSLLHPSGFRRCLFITKDHLVPTAEGWKEVEALQPNDRLFMRCERITSYGKQVVAGLYLGDGHITKKHALVVGHTANQRAYTEHIASIFGKETYTSEVTVKSKRHKVYSTCVPLRAIWHDGCRQLQQKKKLTPELLSLLTSTSLAYWYMDDGNYDPVRNVVRLATDGFTLNEIVLLQAYLLAKFSIKTTFVPRKGKSYGYLYVLAASRDLFLASVAPHMIYALRYKLPERLHNQIGDATPLVVNQVLEPCSFSVRSVIGKSNVKWRVENGKRLAVVPEWNYKYDLTVEKHQNFIAEGVLVHNCAKNAFRSELVKVNQYRKRYHVTSDNLEKFYGAEDHEVDKHDIADEMRSKLDDLTCRWGDPQEIGAIWFLTMCIIDDDHDKQAAIRSASYAYGISFELSKFFYNWAIVNLRHAFYEKVYIPFTEYDLMLAAESYTFWPEIVNIVGIEKAKEISAKLGSQRVKIPSLQYFAKLRENYMIARDVQRSDLDPDAVAEVARKHKKTARTAQEVFTEMVEQIDPRRYGEHSIFHEDSPDE